MTRRVQSQPPRQMLLLLLLRRGVVVVRGLRCLLLSFLRTNLGERCTKHQVKEANSFLLVTRHGEWWGGRSENDGDEMSW